MVRLREQYRRIRLKVPFFALLVFVLTAVSLILHILFYVSTAFADGFNQTVSALLREMLSCVSRVFPFSLAELSILLLIPLLICALIYAYRMQDSVRLTRFTCLILSFFFLIYCLFVLTFASGYRGKTLDEKMGLDRQEVTEKELFETGLWLVSELEQLEGQVMYDAEGASVMPIGFDEMTRELRLSYHDLRRDYAFIPYSSGRAKPVAMSRMMSHTQILGVYTFFTGEANVNTNFNDFCTVFTAAHEMAHQRGFAKEDEANMMAFLACRNSRIPYIQYAGNFEMLRYVLSALASANSPYYTELWFRTPESARGDQAVYAARFAPYRDSVVGSISGAVNDTFLKLQGTVGRKSYGLVVDLAVALYRAQGD